MTSGTRRAAGPLELSLLPGMLLLLLLLVDSVATSRNPAFVSVGGGLHQRQQFPLASISSPSFPWILKQRGGAFGSKRDAEAKPLLPVPAFTSADETWNTPQGLAWTQLLLDSFERCTGSPLIPGRDDLDPAEQARALFYSSRVVVSHQTQEDPVLCYGNAKALSLWEMDLATLTSSPSRLTAEPVVREERQRLLDMVKAKGFIDDYRGVRISATGKRFEITQAIVWEVFDAHGVRRGQAATFAQWEDLSGAGE